MEVWGSLEALESEREKRSEMIEFANGEDVDTLVKKILRKGRKKDNARKFNRSSWSVRALSRVLLHQPSVATANTHGPYLDNSTSVSEVFQTHTIWLLLYSFIRKASKPII